ncbi:MAG: PHB depolymerase family esterase [Myxococcota bacterium]|nr:PHB depolymerase family esterase [Myxococcota bacterium]
MKLCKAIIFTVGVTACTSEKSTNSSIDTLPEVEDNTIDIEPGLYGGTLEHAGVEREYVIYFPTSYDPNTPSPLLLNFHGFGGYAMDHMEWADFRSIADDEGFVVVYPQGTLLDGEPHWNAALPSEDNKSDAEDFGFAVELIDELVADYNLDPERVYASGYSNGGFFSYAMACYHGDKIAAVAVASGTMLDGLQDTCTTTSPTGVLSLHGTNDYVVPYEGSGDGYDSVDSVINFWIDHNDISSNPTTQTEGSIEYHIYGDDNSSAKVGLFKVNGGDHIWFNFDFDGQSANQHIWSFLSQHSVNGLR